MKRKFVILLSVLIAAGAIFSPTASAVDIRISVGDQPYYEYGPDFWDYGWHWVWVPGHWAKVHHKKVWIHGYYERRGDWNVKFVKKVHRWHKHKH
jgi:hypothetical protein